MTDMGKKSPVSAARPAVGHLQVKAMMISTPTKSSICSLVEALAEQGRDSNNSVPSSSKGTI